MQRFRTLCAVLRQGFDLCSARSGPLRRVDATSAIPWSARLQRVVQPITRCMRAERTAGPFWSTGAQRAAPGRAQVEPLAEHGAQRPETAAS